MLGTPSGKVKIFPEESRMPENKIPFNKPTRSNRELPYLEECLRAPSLVGDGPFTRRCEALLEQTNGSARVLLTPSCTAALEMAAFLLDLGPGDEVVAPAFTFVSTLNAFVIRGARPLFVDVCADTLNLDPEQTAARITPRTKAILPVHYGGIACDMDALQRLAEANRIAIVEDNAHGLFARYRGRPLGTFGSLAALSFHDTKNFTCGEGGALMVNDARLLGRAEIVREKGTDRSRFARGEISRYSWVDVGSSYLPSELQAAFLLAQLEERTAVQAARQGIWERYAGELRSWAAANSVQLPCVPPECEPAYHLFHLILPSNRARQALAAHLHERGISAVSHYEPLHLSPMGRKLGGEAGMCPTTERVCERLLRLPFFTSMTASEQSCVIEAVCSFHI